MSCSTLVASALILLLAASSDAAPTFLSPERHVRVLEPDLAALVREHWDLSETLRASIAALDRSDVIVYLSRGVSLKGLRVRPRSHRRRTVFAYLQ